jgi:excisionase family DNA binding protein
VKKTADPMFSAWLSVAEAATVSGLNQQTIHRWIRTGRITQVRGRRGSYRIRLDEVLPLREPATKSTVKQ